MLIASTSGIGKSTLPKGDYHQLESAVSVGDAKTAPNEDEALALLRKRTANVVINTQALSPVERRTSSPRRYRSYRRCARAPSGRTG